jgi:DNA-directed RNA polymerase subunit beta
MLTIKSDDVYGRSKAYESIIKRTEIVGPKVPESFNVLVKELQGLGLKVDLIRAAETVDAEAILSDNIHKEAKNEPSLDVPADEVSNVDVTEDAAIDEFSIVDVDDTSDETVSVTADADLGEGGETVEE